MNALLQVNNLTTTIQSRLGSAQVVDGVSFSIAPGEVFGLVGESGSGKSMTCRSILRLLPSSGRVTGGEVLFDTINLVRQSDRELQRVRGRSIALIVQEPIAALNPVMRIGDQLIQALRQHLGVGHDEAQRRAIELLRRVGIPSAETRMTQYPHQFSGGMCQRVVIALALAGQPRLLLADEPTTALDVTIQDQIMALLLDLQRDLGLSLLLVTHNLGLVAQSCQRVAVMYAGQIVELATTEELFLAPRHPYTIGLLRCVPAIDGGAARQLEPIPGAPPNMFAPLAGCRFHPRCPLASDECRVGALHLREVRPGHWSACIKHDRLEALRATEATYAEP
jgi:peptide/nickel transport system ATP-binding protein/oligopeptide transport system ATP-binding protein